MSERETAQQIDEAAIGWVARLDRDRSDAAQAELELWLAGDSRRRGAYVRAEAAWGVLDRARILGASDGAASDPTASDPRRTRRWLVTGGVGLAASLVGVVGGLVAMRTLGGQRIETAVGEIRRVPLGDGSLALVNTASLVSVDLRPKLREIRLSRGEAWFEVAHDKARPFVVTAGDVRVRAVGTAFSVRRRGTGAEVQVTEGVVEVWTIDSPAHRSRVVAGASAFVADAAGAQPIKVVGVEAEIDRRLAWRTGQIVLDGDTLGAAAEEFNRYNAKQLVVDDPVLAEEKLFGRFRTNEPETFARAASMLGARLVSTEDDIHLTRAQP
jgi:transmembrane sensor